MEGLGDIAVGKSGPAEESKRELARAHGLDGVRGSAASSEELDHLGVSLHQPPPRPRARPHVLRPVTGGDRELEAGHGLFADAVEELLLVADVVVERHRLGVQLVRDAPHRHGFETLLVHDPEGGGHDPFT